MDTGIRGMGVECEGYKSPGCSSEGASPVVSVPGINCLMEQDVVGSAKGTLGVNWKGTWSGCGVSVWGVKGKGSGV